MRTRYLSPKYASTHCSASRRPILPVKPLVALSCFLLLLLPWMKGKAAADVAGQHPNAQLASKRIESEVESLLRKMTLAEKVGQLTQYPVGEATGPDAERANYSDMIAKGQIGSLLGNFEARDANQYQRIAVEKSRLHIPLLLGFDVIHGHRTIFPVPLGMAASFDPELVEHAARLAATEARADGINWVFSPMVDIARDARWGRIVEGAGEDPVLGDAMARAYVRGYQQGDLSNPTSVAACVKHFAAYGAPIAGRDYNAVDMSEITLRQVYLPPYQSAVDAGAATVMSSFNALNGVPASANAFLLTKVLRKEWGFDGMVVSDWGAVAELIPHAVAADEATAARKAITAGVDMDMQSGLYQARVAALVQSGQLPEAVVDEAVRRVLRVKFAMGLFEHPYADESLPPYSATPEKRAIARQAAEETFVLLKNDALEGVGRLLPLGRNAKKIALIGPFADSQEDMLGSWAAAGNPKDVTTLRSALEGRLAGRLTFVPGTDKDGSSDAGFAAAVQAAKQADVVLLALGEPASWTGEASSRAHLGLTGNQEQLLEAISATGKPVVLVLFNGRPLAIPWAAEHVPAILEAWYPGIEAGPALADVLLGDVSPSGKLPVDLPRSVGQEPLYYAQLPSGRPVRTTDLSHFPANPAERYLSRYLDESNFPAFPFGWGLSYSEFQYSHLAVTHEVSSGSADGGVGVIHVAVDVRNAGRAAASEVVQLYIRDKVASVEQPVRELKGFQRVTLTPGEQKHVEFKLGREDLAFYNADLQRVVEPSDYDVWVGGSSEAKEQAGFSVLK